MNIFLHIVNTEHIRAPRSEERSQRDARDKPITDLSRSDQLSEKRFAGNANHQRSIMRAQLL
jgi:hypothetical protein